MLLHDDERAKNVVTQKANTRLEKLRGIKGHKYLISGWIKGLVISVVVNAGRCGFFFLLGKGV